MTVSPTAIFASFISHHSSDGATPRETSEMSREETGERQETGDRRGDRRGDRQEWISCLLSDNTFPPIVFKRGVS